MKYICPLLVVKDIQRSRDFYENLLEQKVKEDFGENITFEGDFSIHLDTHYSGLIDGKKIASGGNNFELYFESDQLDHFAKKLAAQGVDFVHPLREQPWRQKVMRFYDPDQHIIEVGESFEHLCYRLFKEGIGVEKISQITYMPEDFVKQSIQKHSQV